MKPEICVGALEAKETVKSDYLPRFSLLTPQRTFTKALPDRGMLQEHVLSIEGCEERKILVQGHLANAIFLGTSLPTCSPSVQLPGKDATKTREEPKKRHE